MTDFSCDFLCIGAGIAGASAAYALSKHGKVITAERESVPDYHSTGRSAAMFSRCYESPLISALAACSYDFLSNADKSGFCEHPVLKPRGVLHIAAEKQKSACDVYQERFIKQDPDISILEKEEIFALPGTGHLDPDYIARAVWEPEGKDLDVHELHNGYLKNLRKKGGEILLNAEVLSLKQAGKKWHVQTKKGTITAKTVINAAGAWADDIARLAGAGPIGLTPMRRTVITFGGQPDHIHVPDLVYARDIEGKFYFRPEGAHLLGSPSDETPVPPSDVQPEEIDIAEAACKIEQAINFPIRKIDHKWAGLRNFTADRIPVAGFDHDVPGFFWLAGQGGSGIMTAPAMARIAVDLITADKLPADIQASGLTKDIFGPERARKAGETHAKI